MAFRLSATGAPASEGTSRSSGSMFDKMKDRAAAATAAGMAAASTAATKAAKTAKYGVRVARDAAGLGSGGAAHAPPAAGGYAMHDDDDEEMELQRALAASMKTVAEERSRGEEAGSAPVTKAPPGLSMLVEMGFDESLARVALQASGGDVEAALAQLCADREDLEGAVSDGSSVGTPVHGAGHQGRRAALEAAEKRLAEARSNAGTMDDWRQEQRRQAAARAEATTSRTSTKSKPAPEAADDPEELMLQQALASSMAGGDKVAAEDVSPSMDLRQAMAEDELDLQMALSASLTKEAQVDPSCAGAAVGEEAEQEEERARLSAAAQHHLAQGAAKEEIPKLEASESR